MPDAQPNPTDAGPMAALKRYSAYITPILFIGMLTIIVVPLPTFVMDLLLAANIGLAAIVLMTVIFASTPLEFSVFPSLLLGTTLFRLSLNVATTRMILSVDGSSPEAGVYAAGRVIEAFASFVAGSSMIVGLIMFVILIIVQFVVITKGATRISEVAARFQLDAMPGKQMAIDADLNAGLIDEAGARKRREAIQQESDFFGAMDGAAKFVRGDAIAGIIITAVNILGGFAIGVAINGWTLAESAEVFTKLTIGDGLVSQVPSFVISLAAALIVTRSSSRMELGNELAQQLGGRSAALGITGAFLAMMAFTGLPMIPMLSLAAGCGLMAFLVHRGEKKRVVEQAKAAHAKARESNAASEPPPVEQAMRVDTLEIEVGYALVRLVDQSQGGDLMERIALIRRQLAAELGLVMPPVRIRDNMQLQPNDYRIKVRGNLVSAGEGQVYPDRYLAMDGGLASEPVQGLKTREPAFGLEATWIEAGQKQRAESLNYTVIDATSVLTTHLSEVVKNHAAELLTREETNNLIAQLKESSPKLVEEVLGGDHPTVRPGELQRVLQNLVAERVPIRDMEAIVETLGDWAGRTKDLEVLTEYVRNALRRTISSAYAVEEFEDGDPVSGYDGKRVRRLYCVSLAPDLEDRIASYIDRSAEGTSMTIPPAEANRITAAIAGDLNTLIQMGRHPVVLASPQVRAQVRRLLEPHVPHAAVLGYNEVGQGVSVESVAMVELGQGGGRGERKADEAMLAGAGGAAA